MPPWQLEYGARPGRAGGFEFRVWAPRIQQLAVQLWTECDTRQRSRMLECGGDGTGSMWLATPDSASLSAVIFNALIIVVLIPLAHKGVKYRAQGAAQLLRNNLLVYGLGGILVPFRA